MKPFQRDNPPESRDVAERRTAGRPRYREACERSMKLDEFGAEPEPLTADQLADTIGLPRRPHPLATKATRHLQPGGHSATSKAKGEAKGKAKAIGAAALSTGGARQPADDS